MDHNSRASAFHTLHHADTMLLLANAWDAGSALLMQSLGVPALATSSAAVAWAHGQGDGHHLPVAQLLATVSEITAKLKVPLTVDIEGGYSDDPQTVGDNVAAIVGAGAVGINIEDGRDAPELLCRKITAARAAAERLGLRLFINARCDVYLKGLVAPELRVEETLRRARLYAEAGADGLFAAGASRPDEIAAICAGTALPVNILALPGVPLAAELSGLGVRRLSAGSGIAEAIYARMAELTRGFLQTGDGSPLAAQAMSWSELNGLMKAGRDGA
ncbi:MAG: isocitrate lyase/phosphoenolpyruvate mutase family protein [Burkholderiaceae bacterium]|nr:isocitrate lyase/phosphoenolpyruvate mutase family protein [Burkholderiaceae bacterium]